MHVGMRHVPGGIFAMGSDRFYPEESPVVRVRVSPFWMDETPVTNAQFAAFVAATGHVTLAEMAPRAEDYPGLLPEAAHAGSAVFDGSLYAGDMSVPSWWAWRGGADWRHPSGSGSGIDGIEQHPVVHVAHEDALAYARWAGKALPTEAEWEFAARGGLEGADYAWGDELAPDGKMLANYWQGRFPFSGEQERGGERHDRVTLTSPVGSYPANDYGLFDLIGNVWEWTADCWSVRRETHAPQHACCVPTDPRVPVASANAGNSAPGEQPRMVLKGGSHLCAPNYCQRYRPAARYAQTADTTTSHVGFRCVARL